MTQPSHRPSRQRDQADTDLLIKGIVVALIGLAVLVAPAFMAPGPLRATVVESYLVGWFALLLGAAFVAQALVRRMKKRREGGAGQ
jgi:uncharacterized membrane protein HdeD (DUF308 family)